MNETITIKYDKDNYYIKKNGSKLMIDSYYLSKEKFENSYMACNTQCILRRGKNQKIISYSIFDRKDFNKRKLMLISQTAKRFYPDWTFRFYYSAESIMSQSDICDIECFQDNQTNYFCLVESLSYSRWNATFLIPTLWRFLPIGGLFVDTFLSRDSDFCLIQRD